MKTHKLIDNIDPFLGVDGGGNVLCGPYLPFGLSRPGPDTTVAEPNGYRTGTPLVRFSANHVSGTGGEGRYGNIGILPSVTDLNPRSIQYEIQDELASAGYYRCTLAPENIQAELTCTQRVGCHRYTFPKGQQAQIFVDAGSAIGGESIGGFLEFISDHEIQGRADLRGGWGHDFPYMVYFFISFAHPFLNCALKNSRGDVATPSVSGTNCCAIVSFGECDCVNLLVGISYASIANARASVQREVGDRDFDTVRISAEDTWEQSLSAIRVQGGTREQRTLFYTLFSRLLCMPSDLGVDDENAFWHSGTRSFTDIYCLWDSVRNANSFFTLFEPELATDMLNNLIDIAEHTGWLPDFWLGGHSYFVQGGSPADILLCEAAAKEMPSIDYPRALRCMRKNTEVTQPNLNLCGRHLDEYKEKGFLTTNSKNCVSRSIEYSYEDWCIGNLAERLGAHDVADAAYRSSAGIWQLWRDDLKCFAPKNPDGTWAGPFDPCKPTRWDYWNDPYFYEGVAHEWSLCVLHDIAELIERHGGPEAFSAHLDTFFDEYMYKWKELLLHVPYLYHYAGRPGRTAEVVRKLLTDKYGTSRSGLPDNDDMGAQSAFYMCSAIGIYPIMGQDLYLLSTPLFPETEIRLGDTGKSLRLRTSGSPQELLYIDKAELNGIPLKRAWLTHAELNQGGELELSLSDRPNAWGTTELPPSPLSEIRSRMER